MGRGILIAAFDFRDAHEDEFHDWYDLEHVPERERVPGFRTCARWIGASNPKQAIATYDLDSLDVMGSAAYMAIAHDNLSVWSKRIARMTNRLMRFEGEQTLPGNQDPPPDAGGLLLDAMNVVPEHEAEFNEWYDKEHIPALAAVPGTLCARRFRAHTGSPRYVALYHLASPEVQASKAWKDAASSPWTDKLRPFFRDHLRIVARRYTRGA
ncbi:MAG: hypothetical protein WBQ75_17015 [Acetobacteraceae bacterium]